MPEFTLERLPALSPTATDGAIEWVVEECDMVEEGLGIAENQTDKSEINCSILFQQMADYQVEYHCMCLLSQKMM